jgi:hypothetical protein
MILPLSVLTFIDLMFSPSLKQETSRAGIEPARQAKKNQTIHGLHPWLLSCAPSVI